MKNLAPDIVRKRLLIEGFFSIDLTKESLKSYLLELAAHLGLRTYGEPVIYAPDTGMGKDDNAGFDAFVPLIDSGISAYIWSKPKFFSVVIYTCKDFDEPKAVEFTRNYMAVENDIEQFSF